MIKSNEFNNMLTKISVALDIPDHVYEDATIKYENISSWLAMEDSELSHYLPEIYAQGSFRLGTVVRPISNEDEYDIDLVCNLNLKKEYTTQQNLKELVGERLKKRDDLKRLLKESRRCWTLNYSSQDESSQFHMDVLPAINNLENIPTGILLTDTQLRNWQKSNPKAYAEWFYARMELVFLEKRALLAESMNANIEDVPEWQVKTPLQIAVQILKRHRDIYFKDNSENKPVSIIITTLAARAYRGHRDVYDAIQSIVKEMPEYIECRNGVWWVENPVADENFADKWNEYPERMKAFRIWLSKAQNDFSIAKEQQTLYESTNALIPILGKNVIEKVANDLGLPLLLGSTAMIKSSTPIIPVLGDTNHCQVSKWNEKILYNAKINSSIHLYKNGKMLWIHAERAVPKNMWIKFSMLTNVPQPYEVQWQVVNTGIEAYKVSQLRGEFNLDGNIHWESTSYKGTHWVQAFVIKNGICVAKSEKKIVRIR